MEIPQGEDLGFKFKEFMLTAGEQFAASSRMWFVVLAIVVVLAIPIKLGFAAFLSRQMIAAYKPPQVTPIVINARDLQVLQAVVLPTGEGSTYAAYAQIQNSNPDLTARQIDYHFDFIGNQGVSIGLVTGSSYLLGGESRFLIVPSFNAGAGAAPTVKLVIDKVKWTRATASSVHFEVLQKNTGVSSEGNFFVEALIKNPDGWRIKKVDVRVLVFDGLNRKIIAVNQTQFTDLKSFESRYFRLLWAKPLSSFGQIEILPEVNPFEPGAVLDLEGNIPAR